MLSAPEPLHAGHEIAAFTCGQPALDAWLKKRALSHQQRGFTSVVVHDSLRVAGYYGLAPSAIDPAHMPRGIRTGQPPGPVPCLLLGQLAADLSYAGQGIGTGLLTHALARCVAAAGLIGGRAVMVHALDEPAAAFYRRRGFSPPAGNPLLLFRSSPAIAASLSHSGR